MAPVTAWDVLRGLSGVALVGWGAWVDWRTRSAPRWLWGALGALGTLLWVLEVALGERASWDAGPWVLLAVFGAVGLGFVARWARVAGADWRALVAIALLFPFQMGGGPPVWVVVVVFALLGAAVWAGFHPPRGVPFLVVLWGALLLRLAFAVASS